MIALVRVDNRLLHGQVLEAWMPRLGARSVVVADDEAAGSPLTRAAMSLALPAGLAVQVEAVGAVDWAALASSAEPVLVLVREVRDLAAAVAAGLSPERSVTLNLGNIHYASGRSAITPSVYLSESEIEILRGLSTRGFTVEARAVPGEAPVGLEEIERRHRAAARG